MSTYDYYRIFYNVAQQHSFTKAAEVLHNNQPNITRCMNNLETELGCHLFVRSNRGVSLTPEGQKPFNHVAISFEKLELGQTELKRDQSLTSGLISIGVSENALRIMLLSKLEAFHNHYPHVRLKISNHSTPQAIASLESGLVDYIISTSAKGRDPSRDSVKFRRKATELSIPCITAVDTANALVDCLRSDHSLENIPLVDIATLYHRK